MATNLNAKVAAQVEVERGRAGDCCVHARSWWHILGTTDSITLIGTEQTSMMAFLHNNVRDWGTIRVAQHQTRRTYALHLLTQHLHQLLLLLLHVKLYNCYYYYMLNYTIVIIITC